VGYSAIPYSSLDDAQFHGFRTKPNQPIGSWPNDALLPFSWHSSSFPQALNDSGVAVGQSWGTGDAVLWPSHAVLWPVGPPGYISSLDPFTYTYSKANGVNNDGVAVGGHESTNEKDKPHPSINRAWIYSTATSLKDTWSYANDINDHGVVVGEADFGPQIHAFRFSPSIGFQDLGTLNPSCPACGSGAEAINNSGVIVGWSSSLYSSLVYHAFRWRLFAGNPQMIDLGTLCAGEDDHLCRSRAFDINIQNRVVGQSETKTSGDGDPHAFLYMGGKMTKIETLLSPVDRVQWRLVEARAINDLGQIVGTGYFQGDKERAYLLTPPLNEIFSVVKAMPRLYSPNLVAEDRSLGAKIDAVEAAVERGDLQEAHRQLDAHQAEVQGLVETRRLNRIYGTKLLAGVALIRREMESDSRR
jgi:probable HAF family extracellular repeat protein